MALPNETIAKTASLDEDTSILYAGHLLLAFYCIIFTLGFLGNLAVIYAGIRKKKYRNVTNCYVINLALADFLFLTLSIPYTTYIGLVDTHPFGETFCKMYMYLAYVFLLATCDTLSAMSVDRYFYIVFPKTKLQWRTPRNAILVCVLIWIGSLALLGPYHFLTTKLDICGTSTHNHFLPCFLVFCSYYAIPLLIIIVCYTKLAMHVAQSHRLVRNQMNIKDIPKALKIKQRRVTRMVVVVTLAFAICWLPIHVLELMKCANSSILFALLKSHPKSLYTIRALAHAIAYLNSCLNPYLYALLNRSFCRDLIGIIPSCFTHCAQSEFLPTKSGVQTTKIIFAVHTNDEVLIQRNDYDRDDDDDDDDGDDDMYYHQKHRTENTDASCQADLLETRPPVH